MSICHTHDQPELEAWHSFSAHKDPLGYIQFLSRCIEGGTKANSERLSHLPNITQLVTDGSSIRFQLFLFHSPCYMSDRTKDQTQLLNCKLCANKRQALNISILSATLTKEKVRLQWAIKDRMNKCTNKQLIEIRYFRTSFLRWFVTWFVDYVLW